MGPVFQFAAQVDNADLTLATGGSIIKVALEFALNRPSGGR